ncbi:hypothetical protein [Conexibacter woesei]|uniref:Uncharacterized protein n=1 Tax=Conexibacter woesei (strain DSM 14684 / CCUG 47730 / CIP 108061 / JCM 11494 / NBRC 100937 / ID131577) TaxID=469383 RepID=D3F5P9_CONWI|nr:hypothetical protein [Conexibacter woesei]ADB52598.1 hypothetical protein Cwoe_4183 [Conexibacter woesei DSM 14684]
MAAGVVHIPWYATLLRHERLAAALQEVAPIALKYGATEVQIHQSRDDRYRFDHMCWFESRLAWETFWESKEMILFRARYQGWYQIPVLYVWQDVLARIEVEPVAEEPAAPAAAPAEDTAAA